METRTVLPPPVEAAHIPNGQVFLAFEPDRTLTCLKVDGGLDLPDLALILHVSRPMRTGEEDETFHLVEMRLLAQCFARLAGILSIETVGDVRRLSLATGPARGTMIVDADSTTIVAQRNGRLERCGFDGQLRHGPFRGLQYNDWCLALISVNGPGEREKIEIARGFGVT